MTKMNILLGIIGFVVTMIAAFVVTALAIAIKRKNNNRFKMTWFDIMPFFIFYIIVIYYQIINI